MQWWLVAVAVALYIVLVTVLISVLVSTRESFSTSSKEKETVLMGAYLNNVKWVADANSNWVPVQASDDQLSKATPGQLVVTYGPSPGPSPGPGPGSSSAATTKAEAAAAKGYFVILASPDTVFQSVNEALLNFDGKTIGYYDQVDLNFINAVISGYRMNPENIHLVRLQYSDIDTLSDRMTGPDASPNGDIDMIITFIIPHSPFHQHLQTQRVSAMGFANLDIDRVHVFQPDVKLERIKLRTLFRERPEPDADASGMRQASDTQLPYLYATVVRVPAPVPVTTETFISNLDLNNEKMDPSYNCYGDPTIDIRALCESAYDAVGQPKTPGIWDHMCVSNEDCPFYDLVSGRGGCKADGSCEFPQGVKRLSYHKYDSTGVNRPFTTADGKYIFPSL
jgi:hypothetical protein